MMDLIQLEVGMSATVTKTFQSEDIARFAEISGDFNPIHMDDEYINNSRYRDRVVHGFAAVSLFSGIFGMRLPGPGCLFVSHKLEFKRPIYMGEDVEAIAVIREIDAASRHVIFRTECRVNGRAVITGEADIYMPKNR